MNRDKNLYECHIDALQQQIDCVARQAIEIQMQHCTIRVKIDGDKKEVGGFVVQPFNMEYVWHAPWCEQVYLGYMTLLADLQGYLADYRKKLSELPTEWEQRMEAMHKKGERPDRFKWQEKRNQSS